MQEIKNEKSARAIIKILRDLGADDVYVTALCANIAVETGGSFSWTTRQKGRDLPAYGLFQFDPRGGLYWLYQEYLKWFELKDSAEAQCLMMMDILSLSWPQGVKHVGRGNVLKVQRAAEMSAVEATKAFSDHILRPGKPHMERRLAAAEEVAKLL